MADKDEFLLHKLELALVHLDTLTRIHGELSGLPRSAQNATLLKLNEELRLLTETEIRRLRVDLGIKPPASGA